MIDKICNSDECTGCSCCKTICPKHAITMTYDEEGFIKPVIDQNTCISCKLCQQTCPINNNIKSNEANFYYGWNKDNNILMKSSSGGAFTAIASVILDKGGVVFGATLDQKNCIVHHIPIESKSELYKLQMSKYFQSNIDNSYVLTKKYLMDKRYVLFTGTACEIAGLLAYLGNERDSQYLYTCDVLCHGVASRLAVSAYISNKEKIYNKKIIDFHFRVKDPNTSWDNGNGTSMNLFFDDGSSVVLKRKMDTFFAAFNKNILLRESCYQCHFAGSKRISDFTLADYWGASEIDGIDKKHLPGGVSVITFNTDKARSLNVEKYMEIKAANKSHIVQHNKNFRQPQERPAGRNMIYKKISKYGYDKTVKKVLRIYFAKQRIKRILKMD